MTLLSSGESGDPCGVPSSLACHQPAVHDARFQVAPDQPEHPLVMHPSCDPCHQSVVLDSIEKRVEIKIDAPRRVISDELACPLDSLMLRAPRAKPEAVGMEMRVEDRREHLRDGLADQPIHRSRHPQLPQTTRGLGDHHPTHGLRPVSARLELRADLRPMAAKPRPQLLGAHPVGTRGPGVLLDASERLGEVPAGQELLPQATRVGGVSGGVVRRRIVAALWLGVLGLHPRTLPARPLAGLAAINATTTSTNVLALGFAFGPSQRYRSPLVIRPLLTSPRRATPSRTPPSRTTRRTVLIHRTGILGHPRRSPRIRPTAFTAHPPRLRDGPLMDIGLRHAMLARPDRRALYAQPTRPRAAAMRHVFLGSRFRLRLPSHPASRRRSCHWLVVGAINLHRGLPPPSRWSCRAYIG